MHPPPRQMTSRTDFAVNNDELSEKINYTATQRSASNSDIDSVECRGDSKTLVHHDTTVTTFEAKASNEKGLLYREDGTLILQPAPSPDPKDPLLIPTWRKAVGVFSLCIFGAFAAAAELILGAMLPVFALQYAGIDPKFLLPFTEAGGLPAGSDPLKYLAELPNAPPIWEVYMLASLPILMIGVSNLALIPLAISVGRRPVILGCGVIAIAGALWAGFSQSLGSHLAARVFQALGAGTVESLIPFVIQDMVYVHQRNTWISGLFACQGAIIIALGVASPYLIIYLSWRWVYFITAAVAAVFLLAVFLWLPETRWHRTRAEMNGDAKEPDPSVVYTKRTFAYNIALFHGTMEWRKGWQALIDTLRTFFYPQIFFITMLNSAMIACAFAGGYTVAPALLTKPWSWPFLHLGFCLFPILIAAIAVGGVTGWFADWTSNWVAKRRGKRVPENQLLNLILPTVCALVGSVIFGIAGENIGMWPYEVFLFALGLMSFGFLGANTIGAVYVLECYPHLAGPALVNIASFRCIIAFVLSFKVSDWIAELGYLNSMMIYTGLMAFFALLIPVVYFYGEAWRKRWPAEHFGER